MDEICDQAYTNVTASLPQIVASIRALNPDAKIVLLGYTNPVPLLPAWNRYFSKLNRFAKDLAAQEGFDLCGHSPCADRCRRPPHR